jgi:hypothetical protein
MFGDMFGAVNSLFSGLAFACLIYTIFLQKNELGLQRKELEYTREELRGQKETLQKQNEQLAHQAFEGTFFQMVRLHNELLRDIDIIVGGSAASKTLSGSDFFARAWTKKLRFLISTSNDDLDVRIEQIKNGYADFWIEYEEEIGHYFRSLYNIIKFVHYSDVENKKFYTNIVRAQLSGNELLVIFYNGIYFSDSKFVPLIEQYALLKHLPIHKLPVLLDIEFYKPTAFGGKYPKGSTGHE